MCYNPYLKIWPYSHKLSKFGENISISWDTAIKQRKFNNIYRDEVVIAGMDILSDKYRKIKIGILKVNEIM